MKFLSPILLPLVLGGCLSTMFPNGLPADNAALCVIHTDPFTGSTVVARDNGTGVVSLVCGSVTITRGMTTLTVPGGTSFTLPRP